MPYLKCYIILIVALFGRMVCAAQKPFMEGILQYNVKIEPSGDDQAIYKGTFTYYIKGRQLRKELKLDNGYEDVVLIDENKNTIYSLQRREGKKYAIILDMDDYQHDQDNYEGFKLNEKEERPEKIAGHEAHRADVIYKDGTKATIEYTTDWKPAEPMTFERFPGIGVLPLAMTYTRKNGMTTTFKADKIEETPLDIALFKVPRDYKLISHAEYESLNK